jgi:alkaline phosphatase D
MRSATHTRTDGWSRRHFMFTSAAALGVASFGLSGRMLAGPRFEAYPFALGIASGDPDDNGFVLWTRIAPAGTDATFLSPADFAVDWVVAEDEQLRRVVRQGSAVASADWAHSVHVEVDGLRSNRPYWYQFRCGGEASAIGRTRTLPAAGAPTSRLRFALASCQHYEHGYFAAYRHMLADDLDIVLHVGDYIYEGSWGAQVRRHESPDGAQTLAGYRNRHACYKGDADLQHAHAAYPWLVTWDDHEVSNDYAGVVSNYDESPTAFAARRTAAYRAYFEHMPLRARHRPDAGGMSLYRRAQFGDLATFNILDDRQYRAAHACREQGEKVADCPQRWSRGQTMLGDTQQRWLEDGLVQRTARWNVIAQQTLIAPFVSRNDDDRDVVWTDGWDGYAGARAQLLDFIARREVPNVVTLGGDVHAFYATDLKTDFDDPDAKTIATEFVGTSLSTQGDDYASIARDLPLNPHVRHFENRWRGYLRCEITPTLWRSDLRIVDDATDVQSDARTLLSLHVESGRPGVQV